MSKGGLAKKIVPWWSEDLSRARNEKVSALKRYQTSKLMIDKIEFKRLRAHFRYLMKQQKKESWRSYVSKINSKTPINKIWNKVNKIKGKYTGFSAPVLLDPNGNIVSQQFNVGNLIGETLSETSEGSNDPTFLKIKDRSREVRFGEGEDRDYNLPFQKHEYTYALSRSKNTAPGGDNIHYQMIRHLPKCSNKFILDCTTESGRKVNFLIHGGHL